MIYVYSATCRYFLKAHQMESNISGESYFYGDNYSNKIVRILSDSEVVVVNISEGSGIEILIPTISKSKATVCLENKELVLSFSNYASLVGADIRFITNGDYLESLVNGTPMSEAGDILILNANLNDQDVIAILGIRAILSIEEELLPRVVVLSRRPLEYLDSPLFSYYKVIHSDNAIVSHELIDEMTNSDVFDFIIKSHVTDSNSLVYCESKLQANELESMFMGGINVINSCKGITKAQILQMYNDHNSVILTTDFYDCSVMPKIVTVIDIPTTQRNICTFTGGLRKRMSTISLQDSADRKTRVGRYNSGYCRRLYMKSFGEKMLETNCNKSSYSKSAVLQWEYNNSCNSSTRYNIKHAVLETFTKFGRQINNVLFKWISDGHEPYPFVVACALLDSFVDAIFLYPLASQSMLEFDYEMSIQRHRGVLGIFEGCDALGTLCKLWSSINEGKIPSYNSIHQISIKFGIKESYLVEVRDKVFLIMSGLENGMMTVMPLSVIDEMRHMFNERYKPRASVKSSSGSYKDMSGDIYDLDLLFPFKHPIPKSISIISSTGGNVLAWTVIEKTLIESSDEYLLMGGNFVSF